MAIKAYSYAKDGNRKLSANFAVKEFRCKDGSDPIFIDDRNIQSLFLDILRQLHYNRICIIDSDF